MPYLQLDLPFAYPAAVKRRLAKRLGAIHAEIMRADVKRISVAFRELGEGNLWRCTPDDPYPAALLMLDIRRGRPPDRRVKLAEALIAACRAELGLGAHQLDVEFTQHAGDEMYHPMLGGLSDDWHEDEA